MKKQYLPITLIHVQRQLNRDRPQGYYVTGGLENKAKTSESSNHPQGLLYSNERIPFFRNKKLKYSAVFSICVIFIRQQLIGVIVDGRCVEKVSLVFKRKTSTHTIGASQSYQVRQLLPTFSGPWDLGGYFVQYELTREDTELSDLLSQYPASIASN